jgi:aryl-phospho-beta-D-glucosidase BglC (GH1 family)
MKMRKKYKLFIWAIILVTFIISCKKSDSGSVVIPVFAVSPNSLSFTEAGGNSTVTVTMNGSSWAATSDQSWCTMSVNTSNTASLQVTVTATANTSATARTAKLTFVMDSKTVVYVDISQAAQKSIYPSYKDSIAPDATGMSSDAKTLAAKITIGLNIGNTLEAIGGETAWGNPMITSSFVQFVKQSGFNAIRLPCSWNQYADQTTAKISDTWLARVKQVVQYCVDNNLYVVLNIHWDGGWLENNCTTAKKDSVNAKQKAFWEQIATTMRGFDEHVIFASANEPNAADSTQMGVLMSYHQTFIDAVRSTGGKNAYRVLVVQGPNTDIETTNKLMTTLPTDKIANKLIAEVHFYTPWNFCGMTADESWGNQFYYWGAGNHSTTDLAHNPTWGEEPEVDRLFLLMKNQFVAKNIPVIIGEFGAIIRTNLTGSALQLHLASRAYFFNYIKKQAIANGLLPFFWDTGGLLDRKNNTVLDQQTLDALLK